MGTHSFLLEGSSLVKLFMTQFSSNVKSALFCLHLSAHSSGVDIMLFRELRATALFLVAPHRDERSSTHRASLFDSPVWQLSNFCIGRIENTGRAAQIEAKTKFRFGNIVPKQWTLSGFVQHTSTNSMYKDELQD